MTTVATVRGEVEVEELGLTLMHEHVVNINAEVSKEYPDLSWTDDKDAVLRKVVETLRKVKAAGVDTIVDCTAIGQGRDITSVQVINEKVDLNIIVCTGLYTHDHLPFFFVYGHPPKTVDENVEDVLTDMFIRDITVGIAGTGVKAALIKAVTDAPGVTPNVDRVLRAIARAHRETGAPITTHTNAACRNGLEQQRVFADEGVDLRRVVIGHSTDSNDLTYLRTLMDAGSTVGADHFGLYLPDMGFPEMEALIRSIARLCAEGYSDRIVLSHDVTCHNDSMPADFGGGLKYWVQTHVTRDVVPALQEAGVTDDQIRNMLVLNPRRIFSERAPY